MKPVEYFSDFMHTPSNLLAKLLPTSKTGRRYQCAVMVASMLGGRVLWHLEKNNIVVACKLGGMWFYREVLVDDVTDEQCDEIAAIQGE